MANPYREILRIPGTVAFSVAGLLARFPVAMVGIGIVMMLSAMRGSYALAGSVSATFVIAQAIGAPQLARLVDRRGQAKVMVPAISVSAVGLVALVVAAVTEAPTWTLFAAAVVAGATVGSMGALVRARWSAVVHTPRDLHRAYSLESALDESTFVLGPVVATTLATTVAPWSAVATALVLMLMGGYLFLGQRSTEPVPVVVVEKHAKGSVMRSGAMIGLVAVFMCVGGIFGATDVSVVAFTAEHGRPEMAGVLLGIFSAGSMIAGLLYGAKLWTGPAWRRFVVGVAVLAVGSSLFLLVSSMAVMAAVMFVTGFAISPTIINGNALVHQTVHQTRLTEGLTWLSTGVNFGVSIGSSVGGAFIDAQGSRGGFLFVVGSGVLAVVVSVLASPALRRGGTGTGAHLPPEA